MYLYHSLCVLFNLNSIQTAVNLILSLTSYSRFEIGSYVHIFIVLRLLYHCQESRPWTMEPIKSAVDVIVKFLIAPFKSRDGKIHHITIISYQTFLITF